MAAGAWPIGVAAYSSELLAACVARSRRQSFASQQRLQVVGQQQPLRAAARLVVVHDAALEALVDEVAIGGIVGGLAGRSAPHLEGEQTQHVGIAGASDLGVQRRVERLEEIDRLAIEGVLGVVPRRSRRMALA